MFLFLSGSLEDDLPSPCGANAKVLADLKSI